MYLRPHRKKVDGETYEYWSLVKSVRTERGPRQKTVAFIGKEPGLDRTTRVGWEHLGAILDGRAREEDFLEGPEPDPPQWAEIDVSRVSVERTREFGKAYLALALWRRLKLDEFFFTALEPGREEIPWSIMACVSALARFCAPSSELQIAEHWYAKSALEDLLGVPTEKINDARLLRALDAALPCRDKLFAHLKERYAQMFGATFDILLYDITSTYFEGKMEDNPQAKRGYSRDKRPDCLQVCIGLIVTPEGLPIAYEVFDGNRQDVTTVEGIIETMREKYGLERRVWVMDRGMVSEKNLERLREWNACYLVGTPKSDLKRFERELLEEEDWSRMENGVEVKLTRAADGSEETFVLCRAPGRMEKERAMRRRKIEKMEEDLNLLKRAVERQERPLRDLQKAHQRLGRLLERYPSAARFFEVTIGERPDPLSAKKQRLTLEFARRDVNSDWAELSDGCYILRTNMESADPQFLWETYIGLTQVEFSFRLTKSDLSIRPVFHRREDRAQAHIFICFLSLAMWRTLEMWAKDSGLGGCGRTILQEISTVSSIDVVLPTRAGRDLRLRVVSKPENRLQILLDRLGLLLPNRPKMIQNVVQKTPPKSPTLPVKREILPHN